MTPNSVEIGERYSDDSGWERRVYVNKIRQRIEIELSGSDLVAHPRDIRWLIEALQKAEKLVFNEDY